MRQFIGPTPGEAFRPWQDTYSGRGLDLPVPESFLVLEQGLVVLNSTGRKLKQGLRLCYEKWENLRGEINFEDLLFMCSLKVAKPKIFAIVKDKRTVLSDKDKAKFEKILKDTQLKLDDADKNLLHLVWEEVFKKTKFQGLGREEYWAKFMNGMVLEENQRDQPILRAIFNNDPGLLLEIIQDENKDEFVSSRSSKLEYFGSLISEESLRSLFEGLVNTLSVQRWDQDKYMAPGLLAAARILGKRQQIQNNESGGVFDLMALVRNGLDIAVPKNLRLAEDFKKLFLGEGTIVSISDVDKTEISKYLLTLLENNFCSEPDKLAAALENKSKNEWELVRLVDGSMNLFEHWDRFSETMLQATRNYPPIMLPQLAWFVVKQRPLQEGGVSEWDFASEFAAKFGGEAKVLDVLKGLKPQDFPQSQVRALFRANNSRNSL
jgi:hypothetical protein